jgi:RHS repeat-associated protein
MPKNSSFHLPKRSYASSRAHDQKRCSINRNRLTVGTRTVSSTTTQINYGLDAAGNLTSDGLRLFEYDASNRLAKVLVSQNAEASKITYLHNALGQRVFKSEPTVAYTAPDEAVLGTDFITWLKKNFGWLFAQAQVNATLGQGYVYDEANLGATPNLLGEYGNGGTKSAGRIEYIWLPTEDGQSIPIGIYKGGRFYAVHADHINTPRLITDDTNKPVWQWPYSAFGENKPTGILKATTNPKAAITNQPQLLKATAAALEVNLRYPGQYFDEESNLNYNYFRTYQASQGRYTQSDPIGLDGGWSRFAYVENNPLSFIDPDGLMKIFEGDGITIHSYPGPQAGGREHARQGPGENYHVHVKDNSGRVARISTETWKPLTPEDQRIYDRSKTMQKACENLTEGNKKLFDQINRQVFHRGAPTINQLMKIGTIRGGNRVVVPRAGSEE